MSEELTLEEIEALVNQTKFDNSYYVHFDIDTGDIRKVTNELSDGNFIKVDYSEVSTLVTGKETVNDYKVVLDLKTKEYVLQAYYDIEPQYLSWNDAVYKIPSADTVDRNNDVVVEQTVDEWVIHFSVEVHKILLSRRTHLNETLNFYITDEDDVNVLQETIKINIAEIDKDGKFVFKSSSANNRTSVYCRKIFDTYTHVKNEN